MRIRLAACFLALASLFAVASHAQPSPARVADRSAPAAPSEFSTWARTLWTTAHQGQETRLKALLEHLPTTDPARPEEARVLETARRFKAGLEQRERLRAERRTELTTKITDALGHDMTDVRLSDALRWTIELQMMTPDREGALRQSPFREVVARADTSAHAAEARGDWLIASELFYRLHALTEERGTYKSDMERLNQRLLMLRMYVPKRLWELRRDRSKLEDPQKPFPAYNPIGLSFQDKLALVDDRMVIRAIMKTVDHVDRVPMSRVVGGGITALRTMATTTDLRDAFDGLRSADSVRRFVEFLDEEAAIFAADGPVDVDQLDGLLGRIRRTNEQTTRIAWNALLHEFGNGSVGELDEFSALIWPDEVPRFQRQTQGRVIGIGVQLENDEQLNIRVVTPINGGPADKAGIRARDLINKVDGASTVGMSLDQAIDLITGREGSDVTIGVERRDADGNAQEIDFPIRRARIEITTVKGWRRIGPGERDWDYFLDEKAGIGYVRLTQFTDSTTRDFDVAVSQMRAKGLKALILDLRYNPGGLLDEAVKMVRRFVDVDGGPIVTTRGPGGIVTERPDLTDPADVTIADLPLAVLINENSASASEIVSGALRHYTHTGRANNDPALRGILIGQRTFGKGSVQSLSPLTTNAMTKFTIQYYFVPDEAKGERIVHRKPGAKDWGIVPDLSLEILPKQAGESITIRRNSDVAKPGDPPPLPNKGPDGELEPTSTNPDDILAGGLDVQLQAALLLMQAEVAAGHVGEFRAQR